MARASTSVDWLEEPKIKVCCAGGHVAVSPRLRGDSSDSSTSSAPVAKKVAVIGRTMIGPDSNDQLPDVCASCLTNALQKESHPRKACAAWTLPIHSEGMILSVTIE